MVYREPTDVKFPVNCLICKNQTLLNWYQTKIADGECSHCCSYLSVTVFKNGTVNLMNVILDKDCPICDDEEEGEISPIDMKTTKTPIDAMCKTCNTKLIIYTSKDGVVSVKLAANDNDSKDDDLSIKLATNDNDSNR